MSSSEDFVEFRGQGELLAHLGILPVRGSGRSRAQAVAEAEAALRRLGRFHWRRGYRVPVSELGGGGSIRPHADCGHPGHPLPPDRMNADPSFKGAIRSP